MGCPGYGSESGREFPAHVPASHVQEQGGLGEEVMQQCGRVAEHERPGQTLRAVTWRDQKVSPVQRVRHFQAELAGWT